MLLRDATIRLVTHRAYIYWSGLALFTLSVLGCHSDGLYDSCPLSKSIVDACNKVAFEGTPCETESDCEGELFCLDGVCSDGTAYTCVVAEHPFCLEEICASWQGAPAVCTRACTSDDDCPGTGSCVKHQDLRFCVDGIATGEGGVFEELTSGSAGGGTPPTCADGQWACGDGTCIASGQVCDQASDCAGGEDEEGCVTPNCGSGEWECNDGTCIPLAFCGDGEDDCSGGEDEVDCN